MEGIIQALMGRQGGPQNITPQEPGSHPFAERSMKNWQGPLGRIMGRGLGGLMGYQPGQIEGFQGLQGGMGAMDLLRQGGMGGGFMDFLTRMRQRQQQPQPMPPQPNPAGPQNIMAPQGPGVPGAVY